MAGLSRSRVALCATKTSVFSPACCQRTACSASQRTRGSERSASAIRSAISGSSRAAGEDSARTIRSALRRSARAFSAGGAGARREGLAPGEALREALRLRKLLGAEELEQAEEAVGVVLQRSRGQ